MRTTARRRAAATKSRRFTPIPTGSTFFTTRNRFGGTSIGCGGTAWSRSFILERRSRWRDRIKKRRNTISAEEVHLVLARAIRRRDWAGRWFHRRLLEGNLHPVCRVTYHRTAYFSNNGEGAMRLTFDRVDARLPHRRLDGRTVRRRPAPARRTSDLRSQVLQRHAPVFQTNRAGFRAAADSHLEIPRRSCGYPATLPTKGTTMPEWLQDSIAANGISIPFNVLLARLAVSLVLGCAVASIYFISQRKERSETFALGYDFGFADRADFDGHDGHRQQRRPGVQSGGRAGDHSFSHDRRRHPRHGIRDLRRRRRHGRRSGFLVHRLDRHSGGGAGDLRAFALGLGETEMDRLQQASDRAAAARDAIPRKCSASRSKSISIPPA